MRDATIAVEDRRFRDHPGVDPIGIARSVEVRLEKGRWKQGGSTITQQITRTIFLNNQKKFGRKFREAILALAMELKFSKDQILELYLNKVYYGGGAYGIDAAARKFFGHGAEHLSLSEAAVIAGLVKAPSNYSPTADAEAAVGRAGVVIQQMERNGFITPSQAANADPQALKLARAQAEFGSLFHRLGAAPARHADRRAERAARRVDDARPQYAARGRCRRPQRRPPGTQGALVSLDRDGSVRAMVGGLDYVSTNYNRATTAVRQPGSAFAVRLSRRAGGGPQARGPGGRRARHHRRLEPAQRSRRNSGSVSLRTAFAYSLNTVAAKLGQEVGFQTVADMARRFGITTPVNTHPRWCSARRRSM